jgi:tetrapyrrole methylase family protein/MazG family protein
MPTVIVVGLGPAGATHLSDATRARIGAATTARLRTRHHPAAAEFPDVPSFDDLYDDADDFDSLYERIADELIALAERDPSGVVVYAVPGSPVVAERSVVVLGGREGVDLVLEPALSFVDLACAALRIDPIAVGLRLGDALSLPDRLRGPGPLLLAQAHSAAVLADVALRVDADLAADPPDAVVLHHLGLDDERIVTLPIHELGSFADADHLTSVYVPTLRTPGVALEDLVDLVADLRERCPWDRVQTHGSLGRYLLEESYESLDALEVLAASLEAEGAAAAPETSVEAAAAHAREELGDLLFQIVFHAHLGTEEGLFDLTAIEDGLASKLVSRHPHVFGDAVAATPDAVAARWEILKSEEKGRTSVMDGIPDALPALSLMAKVRRKALAAGIPIGDRAELTASVRAVLDALPDRTVLPDDASVGDDPDATEAIGAALEALCDLARLGGVDPEMALRARARALGATVRALEVDARSDSGRDTDDHRSTAPRS